MGVDHLGVESKRRVVRTPSCNKIREHPKLVTHGNSVKVIHGGLLYKNYKSPIYSPQSYLGHILTVGNSRRLRTRAPNYNIFKISHLSRLSQSLSFLGAGSTGLRSKISPPRPAGSVWRTDRLKVDSFTFSHFSYYLSFIKYIIDSIILLHLLKPTYILVHNITVV